MLRRRVRLRSARSGRSRARCSHVVHVGEAVLHHHAPGHRRVLGVAVHVGGVEVRRSPGPAPAGRRAARRRCRRRGSRRCRRPCRACRPRPRRCARRRTPARTTPPTSGCSMSLTSSTCSRPYARHAGGVLGALHARRREDLVGDEDVVLVAPRGVRAADEARARRPPRRARYSALRSYLYCVTSMRVATACRP